MTTPPAGQGKLLLYEQRDKPRPLPLRKQRSTNEPPTAVIQPGEAIPTRTPQTTPTPDVSPSIIRKTSSAEYAERHARSQRGRRQPDPEPLPDPHRPQTLSRHRRRFGFSRSHRYVNWERRQQVYWDYTGTKTAGNRCSVRHPPTSTPDQRRSKPKTTQPRLNHHTNER
jgi:hypothetical protein